MKLVSEIIASEWLNSPPLKLEEQKGKVVVLYAFQMLCPACVLYATPQIQRVFQFYSREYVTVIGLHSVFEHHEAMQITALRAYLYEFRYTFPIAVDRHSEGKAIPETMAALGLQGTPSILLLDKEGALRQHFFGQVADLELGTSIGLLLREVQSA